MSKATKQRRKQIKKMETLAKNFVNNLAPALLTIRLRTFGGYKSDMPSAIEMAEHIYDMLGEVYKNEDTLNKVIDFYNQLSKNKNVVMWKCKGYVNENSEKLMTRNPLHFILNATEEELYM